MWLQKHDPDRVSAVKEVMELQVEACMKEEDEVAAASYCYQIAYTEPQPTQRRNIEIGNIILNEEILRNSEF